MPLSFATQKEIVFLSVICHSISFSFVLLSFFYSWCAGMLDIMWVGKPNVVPYTFRSLFPFAAHTSETTTTKTEKRPKMTWSKWLSPLVVCVCVCRCVCVCVCGFALSKTAQHTHTCTEQQQQQKKREKRRAITLERKIACYIIVSLVFSFKMEIFAFFRYLFIFNFI